MAVTTGRRQQSVNRIDDDDDDESSLDVSDMGELPNTYAIGRAVSPVGCNIVMKLTSTAGELLALVPWHVPHAAEL
jgi:hypothetical protein